MNALETAATELETALKRLENRVDSLLESQSVIRLARAEAETLRRDRAQLANDLDSSKARERELEALADEASRALGVAIAEVKAAMGGQKP